jgi:ActR/RegA family two-component response regulator
MKKFLIIDDDKAAVEPMRRTLVEEVYGGGNLCKVITKPDDGIRAANHTFNAIFIDFKFENDTKTGADIGIAIRRAYPLVPLILQTGFGKGNIRKFCYVGFDDYLEKNPDGFSDDLDDLENSIQIATENAQKRIKSKFSPEELDAKTRDKPTPRERLDNLEAAIIKFGKNNKKIINAVSLLEKGMGIDDIVQCMAEIIKYDKGEYNGSKFLSRQTFNSYFTVYEKDGENGDEDEDTKSKFVASKTALKVRQLLMENSEKWQTIREKYAPIRKFIKDFDLNS